MSGTSCNLSIEQIPSRLIAQASKTVKAKTSGEYLFKLLGAGKYTIRVIKSGFMEFEALDFDVKLGGITKLDVELVSN